MTGRRDVEDRIVQRAWRDDDYRQALLGNPKAALEQELGSSIPGNVQVKVLEESDDTVYLVLPKRPESTESEELSDEALEVVAGGGQFPPYDRDSYPW